MFKDFRYRLILSHMIAVLLALIIVALLGLPKLERFYAGELENRLRQEGLLLAEIVGSSYPFEPARMQALAKRAASDTGFRVTIISSGGVVLGDSSHDPQSLDNHRQRPEVRQALDNGEIGVAKRYSKTLQTSMLYVAVPVWKEGQSIGAVRLAVSMKALKSLKLSLAWILLLALIIAALIGLAVSIVMSRRLSEPLYEITEAVQDMAAGNLSRRVFCFQDDELGRLAQAFNSMAEALAANIEEISVVKNRLETALCNTVNGVLLIDSRGRVEFINPAFKEMIGLGEDENYVGENFVNVTRSYDFTRLIDMVRDKKQAVSLEISIYRRGEMTVEAQGVPVLSEGGVLKGVLVVVHDITKLKKLEQVRRDFVANVSHELKTPIAAISGFAETLLDEAEDPDMVREFAGIIYSEAGRMERMIKNLMEISRLETGNAVLIKEVLDLASLAEEAAGILESQGHHFSIKIKGEGKAVADHDLILQVFINLMDNAIKYSYPPASIEVNLLQEGEVAKVEVTDHGVGIPPSELERVFERFYRVDKARSRQTGGAGLGLSIVRHIIEAHGGTVGVESVYGEGSTFSFTLPAG